LHDVDDVCEKIAREYLRIKNGEKNDLLLGLKSQVSSEGS